MKCPSHSDSVFCVIVGFPEEEFSRIFEQEIIGFLVLGVSEWSVLRWKQADDAENFRGLWCIKILDTDLNNELAEDYKVAAFHAGAVSCFIGPSFCHPMQLTKKPA